MPSYHDAGEWRRPARPPRHAAPPFWSTQRYRLDAHRALRLFVAAGTSAAGLCLVTGSIALAVSAAEPSQAGHLTTASATRPDDASHRQPIPLGGAASDSRGRSWAPSGQPAPSTSAADTPGRLIAAFAGRGDITTRQFWVNDAAGWQIQWAYSCPANVPVGLLVVEDAEPGSVSTSITQSGSAGRGDTWLDHDGRAHRLVVLSTCSWTMTVRQQR